MNNKGLRRGYFSIDGMTKEENVVEGYTDGSTWNGWANVVLEQEQLEKYFASVPYDIRICPPKSTFNPYDELMVIVYNGYDNGDDEQFTAMDFQDDQGRWFKGFSMGGYCFVELEKKETGFKPVD